MRAYKPRGRRFLLKKLTKYCPNCRIPLRRNPHRAELVAEWSAYAAMVASVLGFLLSGHITYLLAVIVVWAAFRLVQAWIHRWLLAEWDRFAINEAAL
jgi:hypothetical protein